MISHRDLQVLAGFADYFPLVGDYLRGATTEVQYETDRGDQFRTHIIVEATSFPVVMVTVGGSDRVAVSRSFAAISTVQMPARLQKSSVFQIAQSIRKLS